MLNIPFYFSYALYAAYNTQSCFSDVLQISETVNFESDFALPSGYKYYYTVGVTAFMHMRKARY